MNYDNPVLLDRLASEYVLGTLRGRARKRFDKLLMELPKARMLVWQWERRINAMALKLKPVRPRARVWRQIEKWINADKPATKWYSFELKIWRSVAAMVALAAIGVVSFFGLPTYKAEFEAEYITIFQNESSQPIWVVNADIDTAQISVQAVATQDITPEQALELWMLEPEKDPVSLGLLPTAGDAKLTLNQQQQAVFQRSQSLAVSLEPAGGSPTGLPTGPVLYVADVVAL
ncbi:MAG: anti-sigma factor [Gammaproteobacteria bacterium]|nr:anti-sigma factor [Gammaproteobacteria bacterium]